MAIYYFRNTGNTDWDTASNWSLTDGGGATGAVPTSSDDAYFTVNSGACLIQTTNANCLGLYTTGYNNTITITSVLLTVSGNCTLSSTTTITGTGTLSFQAASTATLTSNGANISVSTTRFNSGATYTIADIWNLVNLSFTNGSTALNNNTINVSGNLTISSQPGSGTTNIVMTGTGTYSTSASQSIINNLEFNTSGTITISGTLNINAKTLTYTNGTVVWTGSTLVLNSATMSGNWSSQNINNLTITGLNSTTTFSSNMTVLGNFSFIGSGTVTTDGSFTVFVAGNVLHSSIGILSGAITLVMNGTGTLSTNSTGSIRVNLTINTAGIITIGSILGYGGGTFTYISGTVITTGSTLNIVNTCTLATNGIVWNNAATTYAGAGSTITFSSNFNCTGNFSLSLGTNNSTTFNGSTLTVGGSFTANSITGGTLIGTTNIVLNGTGTLSTNSVTTGGIRNNITINTTGTITIGSSLGYGSGTFSHITGTVVVTGSTIIIGASCTFNTSSITWNNISFSNAIVTLTINSLLNANTLTLANGNLTFAGTFGFSVNTLNNTTPTASRTVTLQTGITYTVTNTLNLVGTSTNTISIVSSSISTRANLKLTYGGTQSISNVNATRIDSSGGETLYTTFARTLTDTINWGKREGSILPFL